MLMVAEEIPAPHLLKGTLRYEDGTSYDGYRK